MALTPASRSWSPGAAPAFPRPAVPPLGPGWHARPPLQPALLCRSGRGLESRARQPGASRGAFAAACGGHGGEAYHCSPKARKGSASHRTASPSPAVLMPPCCCVCSAACRHTVRPPAGAAPPLGWPGWMRPAACTAVKGQHIRPQERPVQGQGQLLEPAGGLTHPAGCRCPARLHKHGGVQSH